MADAIFRRPPDAVHFVVPFKVSLGVNIDNYTLTLGTVAGTTFAAIDGAVVSRASQATVDSIADTALPEPKTNYAFMSFYIPGDTPIISFSDVDVYVRRTNNSDYRDFKTFEPAIPIRKTV